jgi:hypothetical protein
VTQRTQVAHQVTATQAPCLERRAALVVISLTAGLRVCQCFGVRCSCLTRPLLGCSPAVLAAVVDGGAGGYVEASIQLPGNELASGLWVGAGYLASHWCISPLCEVPPTRAMPASLAEASPPALLNSLRLAVQPAFWAMVSA